MDDTDARRRNHWVSHIARHAHEKPGAVYLRFEGTSITWAQIHERVTRVAAALWQRGIRAGDRVAIMMTNRPEFLETMIAANAIGAIVVPVNFRLAPDEIAYILTDSGASLLVVEVGEIVYRGPSVMSGYWQNPSATADAFRGGWFHSGDLVRADEEGFLYVVDRKKDMIITGGENVYCAEVENALAAHPAVAELAVIGAPDERWGETPVAVAVLAPGASLTLDELREWGTARLARYKLPTVLHVVDALPRNASGKVMKTALRREYR